MRNFKQLFDFSKEIWSASLIGRKQIIGRMRCRQIMLPTATASASSSTITTDTSWTLNEQRKQAAWTRPDKQITSHYQHFHTSHQVDSEQKFEPNELTEREYEALADETLDSISEYFDELPELASCTDEYDSEFGSGVLTLHFSRADGTYVINKQTPNKQIWLSSPTTGPKRYDFCGDKWIYRHDGVGLHHLLEDEISKIVGSKISLKECKHYS